MKPLNFIRWVIFLPVSLIAFNIIYLGIILVSHIISLAFNSSYIEHLFIIIASGASAYFFVWCGAMIVPKYHFNISIVMTILYILMALFAIYSYSYLENPPITFHEVLSVSLIGTLFAMGACFNMNKNNNILRNNINFKYLLFPFTMILWILLTIYTIYYSVLIFSLIFFVSWIWIIIFLPFMIGIISGIIIGIPALLRYVIIKLYGVNWFSCASHTLAGITGVLVVMLFFYEEPPTLEIGETSYFLLTGMWQTYPFKTIFLGFPFFGIIVPSIILPIITPILMMFDNDY